jgi:hypothetical protein
MERSLAPRGLVVREGVLHERDQRWDDGGARGDEGSAHSLREPALRAAEVLDKVLRRGRHHSRGGSRMVHHVLLSRVRRAPRDTAVGPCPGRRLAVAGLARHASLHTPYHTWLLLPRRAWGTVPSPLCWSCANAGCAPKHPLDVGCGVVTCVKLLRNREQWHRFLPQVDLCCWAIHGSQRARCRRRPYAPPGVEQLRTERTSGGRWDRSALLWMLNQLRPGDVVVVWVVV